MTASHYRIDTEVSGRPRIIKVVIYDTLRSFRAAAALLDGHPGEFAGANGSTAGLLDENGGTDQAFIGVIRLVRGYLTPEIVSHEVAHMAQWLYYCDGLEPIENDLAVGEFIDAPTDPSAHFTNHNERFAYIMGALFATVWEITQK